jgi:hypothetical protein
MKQGTKTILKQLLAQEIMSLEVSSVIIKQKEKAYWIVANHETPVGKCYFEGLNTTRNEKRRIQRRLSKLRDASRAVKTA